MAATDPCAALSELDEALDRGTAGAREVAAILRAAGWLAEAADDAHPAGWRQAHARLFALGQVSLPAARLYEGHLNALRLIADAGTPGQRDQAFAAAADGVMFGVWGADAPGAAATIAGARLAGTKAFASGLGAVGRAIVTVAGADGLTMHLVDADDPMRHDAAAWDVTAMAGSASGRFRLDGLAAEPLGPPGAMLAEPGFHGGLWRLLAAYAGAMDDLTREAARLCAQRGQADDPLMRHRLGRIALEAETARLWSLQAARAVEEDQDRDAAIMAALLGREAIEEAALRQSALVERLAGTALHARTSRPGRRLRDLHFYLRQATPDAKLDYALQLWTARSG